MPMTDKQLSNRDAQRDLGTELLQSVREMKAGRLAQSKTVSPVNKAAPTWPAATGDKVAKALTQASAHAKKQLATQGLKLPTQSWTGLAVRNPAV
jgi:hypothetical protein